MTAFRVLVVCTANICRSPMAEHLLRNALAARRGEATSPDAGIDVSSAGVRGWDGAEMDPPAAAELRRLGGDPSGFRARSFTAALGERAELILTATTEHRRMVLEEVPQALRRTFTLREFAHLVTEVEQVAAAAGDPPQLIGRAAVHRGAARLDAYDLGDPYGQAAEVHRATADEVFQLCSTVAAALVPSEG
jgi:protein-tyrosine phosphatase